MEDVRGNACVLKRKNPAEMRGFFMGRFLSVGVE
jgi:hypothetical protein